MQFSNQIPSFNLFMKTAQSLEDYSDGNAKNIINQQLSKNPTYNKSDEYQRKQIYDDLHFQKLLKAIKKELKINISIDKNNIPIELLQQLFQNREQIKNDPIIQSKKSFNSIEEVLSLLEYKIEKSLNSQDQNIYDLEKRNGNQRFIDWIDYIAYQSNESDVDLTYIRDWINSNNNIDLRVVTQEKALILSKQWHEEIQNYDNLQNASTEILRDTPNKSMNGEEFQQIVVDEYILSKIPEALQESVKSLNKNSISIIELNTERDIKLEGNRMGHCVGGYSKQISEGICEVYSLRDDKGIPFVTIETQMKGEKDRLDIVQIKGRENKIPIDRYRPFVMQWILDNNLYVVGDVEGCLAGNIFDDVLSKYESIEGLELIKGVDLGMLTPYKKSFIDPNYNEKILLSQTKNRDFVLENIDEYQGNIFPFNFSSDREIVLKLVSKNGYSLQFSDDSFKKDREIVLAAVSQNGKALYYADEEFKKDREIVLKLVSKNWSVLEYADEELKKDREIVLAAISQNGNALYYADEEFKKDREIVLAAVSQNGYSLQYADDSLKRDKDFMEEVRNIKNQIRSFNLRLKKTSNSQFDYYQYNKFLKKIRQLENEGNQEQKQIEIEKLQEQINKKYFGGNCGMFAIALAKKSLDYKKTPVITVITNAENLEELMNRDIDIYHIAVEIDGKIYDGDGETNLEKLGNFAYDFYGDSSPYCYYLDFNDACITMIRRQTNWNIYWQEFYKEMKGVEEDQISQKTNNEYYEYLGTCISTVDDYCIWDATEMAQIIENSISFNIQNIFNFLSDKIKNKIKNNPLDIECGINKDKNIVFVYDDEEDIHYFYKIV